MTLKSLSYTLSFFLLILHIGFLPQNDAHLEYVLGGAIILLHLDNP